MPSLPLLPVPRDLLVLLLIFLTLTHPTSAHGYLAKVTIDGTDFTGPYVSGSDSPPAPTNASIRQVADISPVKGASNDDLRCGLSAARALEEAPAKAGSVVQFWWDGGGGQSWPHDTGPLMTYMAVCTGVPDCTTYDPTNAQWFKIDEIGQRGDGWWQADFVSGKSLSVTLPQNLPSAHYLLRSEIIALHVATSVGGAEFYPACVQLNIQGSSGNAQPSPTVSFPGAYSDTDPGIYVPKVFDPGFVYSFPGGAVSNFAAPADSTGDPPAYTNASSSSSSSTSSNSTSTPSSGSSPGSSSSPAPTSPADPSAGLGSSSSSHVCKLTKRDSAGIARRAIRGAGTEMRVEKTGRHVVRRWVRRSGLARAGAVVAGWVSW